MTKELYRLPVYCPFRQHGCDVTVKWSQLQAHTESCEFAVLSCRNPGCSEQVPRARLEHHEQKQCDYLPVVCPECEQTVPKCELDTEHKQSCAPQQRDCAFTASGCEFSGTPAELRRHVEASHTQHSLQLAQSLASVNQSTRDLQQSFTQITSSFSELQSRYDNLIDSSAFESVRQKLDGFETRLQQLRQATEDKCSKSELGVVSRTVQQLQGRADEVEGRVNHLEQQQRPGGMRTDSAQQQSTATAAPTGGGEQAEQLRTKLQMLEVKQAENELRFRLIETAGYSGHMVWKITSYRRRKNDAIDGRTLSLYSQPFYTSPYGYKMCARVYLNGDGMGKGSHMSLFFVVMRSEYDALLSWPFRQRVTLALLDQSGNQRHIKDSFRPDPTSTSFRKPTAEMNIASGSPIFAAHERVESEAFLKDDTIYISVHVDTSDIQDPVVA